MLTSKGSILIEISLQGHIPEKTLFGGFPVFFFSFSPVTLFLSYRNQFYTIQEIELKSGM